VPGRAFVSSEAGEPLGEILIWVENGYLSALEYAWVTDEAPDGLPSLELVEVEGP
jgi:hypothetical protein